jgi:ribose transport system ATP-binding protein
VGKSGARARIGRHMAFVTENRREEGLLMEVSIAENLALVSLPAFAAGRGGLLDQGRLAGAAARVSRTMQIKSGAIERQPVKSLSGGNQQKVVIGKWLMAEPQIIIFDEPTRGIDVGAKYEVYSVTNELAARGAGVLFISSELDELIGVCDRILVMSNGELQGCFERGAFDREQILRAAFRETVV